jgi:hypothetical protein
LTRWVAEPAWGKAGSGGGLPCPFFSCGGKANCGIAKKLDEKLSFTMVRFSSFWVGYLLFSTTKGYQITSIRGKTALFNLKNRKKISPGK